jgi:hypothetical protein
MTKIGNLSSETTTRTRANARSQRNKGTEWASQVATAGVMACTSVPEMMRPVKS